MHTYVSPVSFLRPALNTSLSSPPPAPDRQMSGTPPPVHTAATMFQKLCYDNKDALSAGIIVAGWDKEAGPSVYNIPLGGGLFRQPWAIGGSGSTYVYGYCDATYQEGWDRDQTVEFVKNSACPLCVPLPSFYNRFLCIFSEMWG